jgi:glucan phosphoethanolaminetransferase (alkaline phosphatase superfamily)
MATAASAHAINGDGNIGKPVQALRSASTTAGIALLLVALLGGFGYLAVVDRLLVVDDAVRTAANLAASETLFRLAIASLLVTAVLDVVVAWALFTVFEPVSSRLSTVAATFRVAYAGISVVAIAQLTGVLRLLPQAEELSAQGLSGIHAFEDIYSAGLVLFGFHLMLLGLLVWRGAYAPRFLGILLALAGLGYVVDSFGVVLFAGYALEVATFTFVGEVVLIFWLLLRGRRITSTDAVIRRGAPRRQGR